MSEKVHGNPENGPQTTKEERPRSQADVARALGSTAIKGAGGKK